MKQAVEEKLQRIPAGGSRFRDRDGVLHVKLNQPSGDKVQAVPLEGYFAGEILTFDPEEYVSWMVKT